MTNDDDTAPPTPETCPICQRPSLAAAWRYRDANHARWWECTCDRCGTYGISQKDLDLNVPVREKRTRRPLTDSERIRLCAVVRNRTDANPQTSDEGKGASEPLFIKPEAIETLIKGDTIPSDDERERIIIRAIRREGTEFTETTPEHPEAWAARTFLPSWAELKRKIDSTWKARARIRIVPPAPDEGRKAFVILRLTKKGIAQSNRIRKEDAAAAAALTPPRLKPSRVIVPPPRIRI